MTLVTSTIGCVVASVQTLVKEKRFGKFDPKDFGTIIVDECVTGDTLIQTEKGEIRIDQIPVSSARRKMTHSTWSLQQEDFGLDAKGPKAHYAD